MSVALAVPAALAVGIGGTAADPALAGLSDGLTYSAMAAYAVALVAYAIDLAGGRPSGTGEPDLVPAGAAAAAGRPRSSTART